LLPDEIFAPKLSRLPTNGALGHVRALLSQCFWPLDVRHDKVIEVIDHLRAANGTEAARQFVRLDTTCQFFVRFALEVYGLKLVAQKIGNI
jgi:hypothetical protein